MGLLLTTSHTCELQHEDQLSISRLQKRLWTQTGWLLRLVLGAFLPMHLLSWGWKVTLNFSVIIIHILTLSVYLFSSWQTRLSEVVNSQVERLYLPSW